MKVELTSLELKKAPSYASENANQWLCKVEYKAGPSETALLLSPEAAVEIMKFLGPFVVKHASNAAQSVAENLQAAIDESANIRQIEAAPKAEEAPIES